MKNKCLFLLILLVCIFLLVGCNGVKNIKANVNEVKEKKDKSDTIAGNYEIYKLVKNGKKYNKKYIDSLDLNYVFEVHEDNTAYMKVSEREENFTYDKNFFVGSKDKLKYKYEKGILILYKDNMTLKFKKKK